MVSLTLSVPAALKKEMEEFPELNWSEVARQAFAQKIADLVLLKEFKSQSTMTEGKAIELGRKVRKQLSERLSEKNETN